jgi:hypothetical protein
LQAWARPGDGVLRNAHTRNGLSETDEYVLEQVKYRIWSGFYSAGDVQEMLVTHLMPPALSG